MKIRRVYRGFLYCLLLALLCAGLGYYVLLQQLHTPLLIKTPVLFRIDKGQSAGAVLNRLQQQNIVDNTLALKVLLKLLPQLARLKAGTYELLPSMDQQQALQLLLSGKEKLFAISLIEGLRWRDWQQQLVNHQRLVTNQSTLQRINALVSDLPGHNIEGWLMPDTYHFADGTNAADIVMMAYHRMQQYLQIQWQERQGDLPYSEPYQGLIMASIIEKETAVAAERSRIAGVFVNRLNLNMRLQTDPTVIYGLGESFDGDIKRKDLTTPSPYNTYLIKGLPPTPIAMPGKLAVEAAFKPMMTDKLYFVAKGDGSHQFSATLAEHNQAVKRYQLSGKIKK